MVYSARSRALACMKWLVHVSDLGLLPPMRLITLELPDRAEMKSLAASELPDGWDSPVPAAATPRAGDLWAQEGRTLLLEVPSAIITEEVKIAALRKFRFDLRLG
jgi:hypothetical protein